MNITKRDYLFLLKELMEALGSRETQVQAHFANLQSGHLTLENLSANVAIQCFMQHHISANADILRTFLSEHQKNQRVEFADD